MDKNRIMMIARSLYPSSPEKQREFFDMVSNLSDSKLQRVTSRIRRQPDARIEEIINDVCGKTERVDLRVKFTAAQSRGLLEAVRSLNKPPTRIVMEAVSEWLKTKGFIGRGGRPLIRRINQERRTPEQICAGILEVCVGGANQSQIVKRANLCYSNMKRYLRKLVDSGMLKYEEKTINGRGKRVAVVPVYTTTKHGYAWLQKFKTGSTVSQGER